MHHPPPTSARPARRRVAAAAFALAFALALADGAQAGTRYVYNELPGSGTQWPIPSAINASGAIVGEYFEVSTNTMNAWALPAGGAPVSWQPLGGDSAHATAISPDGTVIGRATTPASQAQGLSHAFVTRGGVSIDLFPGDDASYSGAYGINRHDVVVGGYAPTLLAPSKPFRYEGGTLTWLSLTKGARGAAATAINDRGVIAGNVVVDAQGTYHAFVHDGRMRDLGTLGGPNSAAAAINVHGVIAGWSETPLDVQHAVVWRPGTGMVDLGTLHPKNDADWSYATGINAAGVVVGMAHDVAGLHAVAWQDGRIVTLDSVTDGVPAGLTLQFAFGIDDAGQIVGVARHGVFQNGHGFVLVPVTTP